MRRNETKWDADEWEALFNLLRSGEEWDGYEHCPGCGAINAYAWQDANMDPNTRQRFYLCGADGVLRNRAPDIYHIPTCSAFDWSCGKCGTGWAPFDSPIMAEVYTHIPREGFEDGN